MDVAIWPIYRYKSCNMDDSLKVSHFLWSNVTPLVPTWDSQ